VVALLEADGAGADTLDDAPALVAAGDRVDRRGQVAGGEVVVGVAEA
jgi:hypothetical protein